MVLSFGGDSAFVDFLAVGFLVEGEDSSQAFSWFILDGAVLLFLRSLARRRYLVST
jgi:hypothetical protein